VAPLFTLPKKGISLQDEQEMTKLLLGSGARIQDINCVRKHISKVKGGQLAQMIYPAVCISLLISDVVGDDIGAIASGPTAPDRTSFVEAWDVLERYGLIGRSPSNIIRHLKLSLAGMVRVTQSQTTLSFRM
jgi:glycerate 2-kinase